MEDHGQVTPIQERGTSDTRPPAPKKPWPLSWILIVILSYIALQTAFLLFFGD
ncbi:MAG: hypothetical protein ACO3ZW_08250 [Opitutales bacterium]|jgi:hypothetical protein